MKTTNIVTVKQDDLLIALEIRLAALRSEPRPRGLVGLAYDELVRDLLSEIESVRKLNPDRVYQIRQERAEKLGFEYSEPSILIDL